MKQSGSLFDIVVFDSNGVPLDWGAQHLIMVLDLDFMPAFEHRPMIVTSGHGCVRLPCADGPFALCMPLPVAGFGHVYVYADNEGRGYTDAETAGTKLNLNIEFARSRLAAVKRALDEAGGAYQVSTDCANRLDRARSYLDDAEASQSDLPGQAKLAMASLRESLHAGEIFAVDYAKQKIKSRSFYFGCNAFGYKAKGPEYAERFADVFNYITAPFYRSGTEKEEGKRDHSVSEAIAAWANEAGMTVKGHPLIWLHEAGTPDWLRGRSRQQVFDSHIDYVADAVRRFKGRIDYWDVINEAHSWNNLHRWEYEDLIEITKLTAKTAGDENPDAFRVVNNCFTWSEYVATGWGWNNRLVGPGRSTLQYCKDIIAADVDFEAIGLQLYDPSRDLFEISRHIDMFCTLGKKVHITEIGISSSNDSVLRNDNIYVPNRMLWHERPWSENEQADWIEGFYTICYAKPDVEAITWWDFADPAFLAHGGLLTEDLRPKEGYRRLKSLVDTWRR